MPKRDPELNIKRAFARLYEALRKHKKQYALEFQLDYSVAFESWIANIYPCQNHPKAQRHPEPDYVWRGEHKQSAAKAINQALTRMGHEI